jgi:hypothetical protein
MSAIFAVRGWSLPVFVFFESERRLSPAYQDGPPDQIRLVHHQIDRFLLGLRQRPCLEYRAARAYEIQEVVRLDVLLEKCPVGRVPVDVALFDADVLLLQKTSGVAARGSGRFPVENRLGHAPILPGCLCAVPDLPVDVHSSG